MAKRDLIWRLRNVKAKLAASGAAGRLLIPVVEVCEFSLSHGFRDVIIRSRSRLGFRPVVSRMEDRSIVRRAASKTARLFVATKRSVGSLFARRPGASGRAENGGPYERSYFSSLNQAQNRAAQHFVPETNGRESFPDTQVRALAFYLPQFHPIPENDAWWGKGFTEWTNVSKAVPQFEGHYQPHLPGELGFYDLRVPAVQRRQVELARKHGIHGFCFHYYWFNGKRLLERPLDQFVADPMIDFPFCICWANENWTRRWDGLESDVLIAQVHSEESDIAFINSIEPLLRDRRYITVGGRPLVVVYRVSLMPNPHETVDRWKAYCRDAGLREPYLVAAQSFGFTDPRSVGFDAAVEFPPHNIEAPEISGSLTFLNPGFEGRVSRYEDLVDIMRTYNAGKAYKVFKCVCPGWDNDPRKPGRGYTFADSTPESYRTWLDAACAFAREDPDPDARLVFINAWNEWAEGAYLEPDLRYGYAYLEATRQVVTDYCRRRPTVSVIVPNYNHAVFLERRLNSIVNQSRRPDEVIFLDDASTDESVTIAERILRRSNIKHHIVANEVNSGNVFAQWLKGLEHAQGDLIWIAESDDEADLDFLRAILPQFAREDVSLAYGEISYINPDGSQNDDLAGYYQNLSGDRWHASHTRTGHDLFSGDFAVKNLIPNASGALFRKPVLSADETKRLTTYRFAGDWYFYALVSRGGSIGFCKEAKSYFRKIATSTSRKAFFTEQHTNEHRMILQDLRAIHGISEDTVARHVEELQRILSLRQDDRRPESTAELLKSVQPRPGQRALRVCIASHGFSIGGGELAPVMLANALRGLGHHVTFLIMNAETPGEVSLRPRLRPDIPVLRWHECASRFDQVTNDFGFDVINSHNVEVEYAFFRRGITPTVPYVATLHGGYETVPEIMTKPFVAYLARAVGAWLYTAEKNKEPLITHGLTNPRFVKVFNAVSLPQGGRTADVRRTLNMAKDSVALVLASRAIHDKGWDVAIDATRRVRADTGRDVRLVLIGDGENAQAIKDQANDASYVHFWGRTEDVASIIRDCDLAVFPSTFSGESFPLFLLECFAVGLPLVATDVGSIREMMTTEEGGMAGALISTNSDRGRMAEDMAAAINALLQGTEPLKAAKLHAQRRSQYYDIHRMAGLYLDVFASLPTVNPVMS